MTQTSHSFPSPSPFTTRRQFILTGMAMVGAAWAGVWAQSRLFPQASSAEARPIAFPLAELPVGGTKPIVFGATPALVIRTPEGIRCFSLVCTHLGCIVQWQDAKKGFYCPCHDGHFDQFGEVVSGPPPLALEQIPVKVAGEQVIVGEA